MGYKEKTLIIKDVHLMKKEFLSTGTVTQKVIALKMDLSIGNFSQAFIILLDGLKVEAFSCLFWLEKVS